MRDIFRTILISLVVSVAVLFGLGETMLKLQAGPPAHWGLLATKAPGENDVAAKPGDESFTPNLVGVTVAEARERWQPLGIAVVEHGQREGDQAVAGVILEQTPSAGAFLPGNKEIRVIIARAKPKSQVPDVVGKSEKDAVAAIQAAGLKVVRSAGEVSTNAAGTVLRQEPLAAAALAPGSEVALVIASKGVSMPKLVGKRLSQAKATITELGLQVGKVTSREHPEYSGGRVLEQSLAAGAAVAAGAQVDLVVVAPD